MPLITLILVLACVGCLLWVVNRYVPMEPPFKSIINVIVIVAVVLWLLSAVGALAPLYRIRV